MKLLELFTVLPLTRTLTGPLVAPAGTFTWMLVLDWLRMAAGVPLKVTMPLPTAIHEAGAGDGHRSPHWTAGGRDPCDGRIGIEGEGDAVAGFSAGGDYDIAGRGLARHLDGDRSVRPRNDIGRSAANGDAAVPWVAPKLVPVISISAAGAP